MALGGLKDLTKLVRLYLKYLKLKIKATHNQPCWRPFGTYD